MRTVCGWCTTPLPNGDHEAWQMHHWLAHERPWGSYSVRHYYDDDPLERLLEAS